MSMDQSAIETIIDQANSGMVVDTGDFPTVVVPKSHKLESIEHLFENRFRFRGHMETESVEDFIKYTNSYESPSCFINAKRMSAQSIFNLGDTENPGHGDHKATLSLVKMAAYEAACSIDGAALSQKDSVEWIEDWQNFLVAINADGGPVAIHKALASLRNIKIEAKSERGLERQSLSETKSAMEHVEASSRDGDLPESFVMNCYPYDGLYRRDFTMRLSIRTGGSEPMLVLRISQHEDLKEQMAQEFKDLLLRGLDTETVVVGTFDINNLPNYNRS